MKTYIGDFEDWYETHYEVTVGLKHFGILLTIIKFKIMKISQEIPQGQKEILIEALNMMESALKTLKSDEESLTFKLFDIQTLKAMLNKTELVVNLPFDVYENFTSINGVDFPDYVEDCKKQ